MPDLPTGEASPLGCLAGAVFLVAVPWWIAAMAHDDPSAGMALAVALGAVAVFIVAAIWRR